MTNAPNVPLLQVKNLRIEFPTRRGVLTAVDDISFNIAAGEVLGVVGESGAGKSLTGAAVIGFSLCPQFCRLILGIFYRRGRRRRSHLRRVIGI